MVRLSEVTLNNVDALLTYLGIPRRRQKGSYGQGHRQLLLCPASLLCPVVHLVRLMSNRAVGVGDAGGAATRRGVLSLLVATEVDLPLERPAAEVAAERLEPGVLPAVGDEVRRLAERLAADRALVGLFSFREEEKT